MLLLYYCFAVCRLPFAFVCHLQPRIVVVCLLPLPLPLLAVVVVVAIAVFAACWGEGENLFNVLKGLTIVELSTMDDDRVCFYCCNCVCLFAVVVVVAVCVLCCVLMGYSAIRTVCAYRECCFCCCCI